MDIIVPVSFNFPSLGKLLVLLYVLFAAWFTDTDVNFTDSILLVFNGVFSLFGSINVAVPYLLDSLKVPADMFQLFLVTGIVVGRFGAMLAALHIIALGIIVSLALSGRIQFSFRKTLRYFLITLASLFVLVTCLRAYFSVFVPEPPGKDQVLSNITLMQERVPARVNTDYPAPDPARQNGSRIDSILETGLLKVGYLPHNLPCTYLTPDNKLVGFDVEMAHILAEDLGVELEFTAVELIRAGEMLSSGQIDIGMSCVASLPDMYREVSFSRAYLDLTLALVVEDHRRNDFRDLEALQQQEITVALVASHYFAGRVRRALPSAKIVVLKSAEEFFKGEDPVADVLVLTAEEGAAYTYRYPRYTVTSTITDIKVPASYAVPKGDIEMLEFISNWVDLKRSDGTIETLYQYWMLGGVTKKKEPRWSIIRDVLHWVD